MSHVPRLYLFVLVYEDCVDTEKNRTNRNRVTAKLWGPFSHHVDNVFCGASDQKSETKKSE